MPLTRRNAPHPTSLRFTGRGNLISNSTLAFPLPVYGERKNSGRAPSPVLFAAPGRRHSKRPFLPAPKSGARGTPGSQPARGLVWWFFEKPHERSRHEPPIASAFRARCEWLAPCSPPVDTGFLSTASARTRLQAGCHGLGLRRARYVQRAQRPPLPAPRVVTIAKRPLERDGMHRRCQAMMTEL